MTHGSDDDLSNAQTIRFDAPEQINSEKKEESDAEWQKNLFIQLQRTNSLSSNVINDILNDNDFAFSLEFKEENQKIDDYEQVSFSFPTEDGFQEDFGSEFRERIIISERPTYRLTNPKLIANARGFLIDLCRNDYEIHYTLARESVRGIQAYFNQEIDAIFQLLRQKLKENDAFFNNYAEAILLLILKAYFLAKKCPVVEHYSNDTQYLRFIQFIEKFKKKLDGESINELIEGLENWEISDAPATLDDLDRHCKKEVLHRVFFSEDIGQQAASPIYIELRSALKMIDNGLNIGTDQNTEKNRNKFHLAFKPAEYEQKDQVIFTYTMQGGKLTQYNSNQEALHSAYLPLSAEASLTYAYSPEQKKFIEASNIKVSGDLKSFVNFYHKLIKKWKKGHPELSEESIPKNEMYKIIQKEPLTNNKKRKKKDLQRKLKRLIGGERGKKDFFKKIQLLPAVFSKKNISKTNVNQSLEEQKKT